MLLVDEAQMKKRLEIASVKLQAAVQAGIFFGGEKITADMEGTDFQRMGSNAVIPICGPVQYKYDFWCWLFDGTSYQGIQGKFSNAINDESIDRIILYVDCPGGEVTGCAELGDYIYASRGAKEIVAVVDPLAASAGYWLASQADRIVGIKSCQTGCIGTMYQLRSYSRMFEEEGIDVAIIRSKGAELKNIGHPLEPMTDEVKAVFQAKCDKLGEEFYAAVARGRGVSVETVKKDYGKGECFYGDEALSRGMLDQIGTFQSVLSETKAKPSSSSTAKKRTGIRGMQGMRF